MKGTWWRCVCVCVCVKSPTVKTMSSVDMQKRTVQRCYGGWGNSQESEHAFFVRAGLEREARQQIHNCYYYHYHYCDFIFKTTAKNKKKKKPTSKKSHSTARLCPLVTCVFRVWLFFSVPACSIGRLCGEALQ